MEVLRGEDSIAELCRREGIAQSIYYIWSKEYLETAPRLAGDRARRIIRAGGEAALAPGIVRETLQHRAVRRAHDSLDHAPTRLTVGNDGDGAEVIQREVACRIGRDTPGRDLEVLAHHLPAGKEIVVPLHRTCGTCDLLDLEARGRVIDVKRRVAARHLTDARMLAVIVEGERVRALCDDYD